MGPPLPDRLDRAWRSLAKADELVQGFAERGWVASETMTVVGQRTHDLARRVGRLQERGAEAAGEAPGDLAREVDQLTALLVALSDEAVARQPDLAPEVPVVVSLADAQRRLGSTQDLYGSSGEAT